MATRKQRRRREKEHRHEYVFVDDAGNEIAPPHRESKPDGKPAAKASGGRAAGGGGRVAQPPSWRRVIRRGLIFAPIFLAVLLLLGGDRLTFLGAVIQTLFLLVVFVPFSYLMDRFVYRTQQRRLAKGR